MPNGFHGSKEELDEHEALLSPLDDQLKRFVQKKGVTLSKSERNWPDRSLHWQSGDVDKLIQIYLADAEKKTFHFWICASQDKDRKRYWKNVFLKENVPISEITDNLAWLLDKSFTTLESWQSGDLELATDVSELNAAPFWRGQALSWIAMLLIVGGIGLGFFLLIRWAMSWFN